MGAKKPALSGRAFRCLQGEARCHRNIGASSLKVHAVPSRASGRACRLMHAMRNGVTATRASCAVSVALDYLSTSSGADQLAVEVPPLNGEGIYFQERLNR